MTEDFPKPRYEPPIMIDLGGMAKGKGDCVAGLTDTGARCTAGTSNLLACTAGTAAQNECTSGTSAILACTNVGAAAVNACSPGGSNN